ncbi:MAG: glycosyltransferase [Bacteroidales bacterium]|nr:glycosyltransferase [Bacteroidales bacterium]
MIRICHVTSVHPANDVRIFYKECLSLAKHYEVFLVAPNVEDAVIQGVHRVGVTLPTGRLKRQLHLRRVLKKALEVNADIYHFHDPELIPVGLKIKRHGKKIIFDSHEDVPMQLLTKEYLPRWSRPILSHIYATMERIRLARYHALVTVTPTILERLATINPHSVMVTNYPNYQAIEHNWDSATQHYVCFAGEVAERYMHENIINALGQTEAKYLLAGRVFIEPYFKKLQTLANWNRVEYLGVLPPTEVGQLMQRADIGLVLLDYSPNVGYHKGSLGVLKMFEYMMAGIPVIATDFELWQEIIERYDCGICVNPNNTQAIADAINYLIHNPDIARQKGENGRRAVQQVYNWATQEQILFDLYKTLK